MNNEDETKRLEIRLIDISHRLKSFESIIIFIKKFKIIIMSILIAIIVSIGMNYYRVLIVSDIKKLHDSTVAKVRYSIYKKSKQ